MSLFVFSVVQPVVMSQTSKKLRRQIGFALSVRLSVTFLGACETREWHMLGTRKFINVISTQK